MPLLPTPQVRPTEGGTPGLNHPIKHPPKPKTPSGAQHVTLTSTRFGTTKVRALLDAAPPQISSGYGNFDEIARPGRRSLINWSGVPPRRMSLALILDAWSTGGNVVHDAGTLEYLATGTQYLPPPTLQVTGAAIPHPELRWCIAELAWGETLRDATGLLVRQYVALTLIEDVADSQASSKRKAPNPPRSGQTVKLAPPGGLVALQRLAKQHHTTVKAIALLNKFRSASTVKAGTQLRLP